jgi:hypothetical protein
MACVDAAAIRAASQECPLIFSGQAANEHHSQWG